MLNSCWHWRISNSN